MRFRDVIFLAFLLVTSGSLARGQAVIEGRVTLSKTRSAPVVTKRYEIVTKGGVIAPSPPVAVVYLEKPIPSQIFDVPGLVTLRCDIHEHMRGLILVLETPYFVTTDTDGRFKLTGLPAGRYQLKAWLSSKTTFQAPVELQNSSTVHLDLP
jgi:hypothetical protein